MQDRFNLERFVREQETQYAQALAELRAGRKQSHWMWYVLPQLKGLGFSAMSEYYGISGRDEAEAYLGHPVLGYRLVECVLVLMDHAETPVATVLGDVDAMKYQSCLTLFEAVTEKGAIFTQALQAHYTGQRDQRTLELLARTASG